MEFLIHYIEGLSNSYFFLCILIFIILSGLTFHTGQELSRTLLIKNGIFKQIISLLANEQQLKIVFNSLEGSYALCLTGNIIDLASALDDHVSVNFLDLTTVIKNLLDLCGQYVTAKKSNLTHWHPVLGWFSVSMDSYLQNRYLLN